MSNYSLLTISPIDGRYSEITSELSPYFSEFALMRYRVLIEIEYFIALCRLPIEELKEVDKKKYSELQSLYKDFSLTDANNIKDIEKTTNHDIKAIEYFIKEKLNSLNLIKHKEFIHFALTSQDINNTAFPLMLKEAHTNIMKKFRR
jgi:adenylosuccinate lyase